MSFLDRFFGAPPAPPKTRATISPAFEASGMSRRFSNWTPSTAHINALLSSAGTTMDARARWLYRNNAYARNAVEAWAANTVGSGIKPSSLIQDPTLREQVAALWLKWTDESDAEGLTDFYGQMRRVAREDFLVGEAYLRFRPRFVEDGLSVPLQVQILPKEMLRLDRTELLSNGNQIRQGIEFNRIGKRVGYWFWRQHPHDASDLGMRAGEDVRIPASEIVALFDPPESGSLHGATRLAPVMVPLMMLDLYDDAMLDRQRVSALFAVFITSPDNTDLLPGEDADDADDDGKLQLDLRPGLMQRLAAGEDIKNSQPPEVGQSYDPFQYRTLVRISTGLGMPYMVLTGDMRGANYSSMRGGLLEFRRRIEGYQHSVLVAQMLRVVWRRWLTTAVLSGAVPARDFARDPEKYLAFRAIPPRFTWVDPFKDRMAEKLAVRAGFKSRGDVIEEEGYDPEETDRRIAAERERARKLGLVFDSDADLVSNAGVTNARPPESDFATDADSGDNKQPQDNEAA